MHLKGNNVTADAVRVTEVAEAKAQRPELVRLDQHCPTQVSCKAQMSFKISSGHTKKNT